MHPKDPGSTSAASEPREGRAWRAPGERRAGERQHERQDERGDERRDALLSAICHDLRAPLAAVMMGANFVLQTTPDDAGGSRSRRVLKAMVRSCRQMERLVRDFGEISEMESGRLVLRQAVHDAGPLIDLALESAREAAAVKNVTLESARPTEAVLLRCDRDRVLAALGHLLDNAIRVAPDGSTVVLRLEDEGERVRLSVVDHGPGVPEETMAHLFDRAWHASRSNRSGAGLGLAIARGVALAHGGTIDVAMTKEPSTKEPTTKEPSTTFSLGLPKNLG